MGIGILGTSGKGESGHEEYLVPLVQGANAPDQTPRVTVVIPTRNRVAQISSLLERLLGDPEHHEIIVVDDGSSDGTSDMLRGLARLDPRVVPIESGGAGASRARLIGARAATGDLLVLLDDDVMPMPGLVSAHAAHHTRGDRLLVLGYMPTKVPDPLPPGGFATLLYAREYEARCVGYEAEPSTIMTALWLGNTSLSRDIYLEAFDSGHMPTFTYPHEDRSLGIVLRDLGLTAIFDRGLFAQHVHSRPLEAFLRDCFEQGRGREAIRRLYPDVVPEPAEQYYLTGLPGPLRSLFAATRREWVRRTLTGTLTWGIRGSERFGATAAEIGLARLVRKIEQLHGSRDEEVAASGAFS